MAKKKKVPQEKDPIEVIYEGLMKSMENIVEFFQDTYKEPLAQDKSLDIEKEVKGLQKGVDALKMIIEDQLDRHGVDEEEIKEILSGKTKGKGLNSKQRKWIRNLHEVLKQAQLMHIFYLGLHRHFEKKKGKTFPKEIRREGVSGPPRKKTKKPSSKGKKRKKKFKGLGGADQDWLPI